MKIHFVVVLLSFLFHLSHVHSFVLIRSTTNHNNKNLHRFVSTTTTTTTTTTLLTSHIVDTDNNNNGNAEFWKKLLYQKIDLLRSIQILNGGSVNIDYGVKGGELDAKTRAPQIVNYYTVSDAMGYIVDEIVMICHQLVQYNPTPNPTQSWGTPEAVKSCPLHGRWKLLFTTAADALFTPHSKRGDAIVQNEVDAVNGWMSNIIDFIPGANLTQKPGWIEQLLVRIKATALNKQRIALEFRYAKVTFRKAFIFFGYPKRWSLYIPVVPATFLTRILIWTSRLFVRRNQRTPKPPKAYFDIMYLDQELRIHKTGEENIFVQARPNASSSSSVKGLLRS